MRWWPTKGNPAKGPVFDAGRCTRCGDCVALCPARILAAGEDGLPYVRSDCTCVEGCRTCARICTQVAATFEDEEFFIDYLKRRLSGRSDDADTPR